MTILWIILALIVGSIIGFFGAGLCQMARDEITEYGCNCGLTDEEIEER